MISPLTSEWRQNSAYMMGLQYHTRFDAVRIPANTRRLTNVGLMLAHRLRRWATIKPTIVKGLVFAGQGLPSNISDQW